MHLRRAPPAQNHMAARCQVIPRQEVQNAERQDQSLWRKSRLTSSPLRSKNERAGAGEDQSQSRDQVNLPPSALKERSPLAHTQCEADPEFLSSIALRTPR